MTGDCCFFKFLRRNVGGKHLIYFPRETSVLKFLWISVEGAFIIYHPHIIEILRSIFLLYHICNKTRLILTKHYSATIYLALINYDSLTILFVEK